MLEPGGTIGMLGGGQLGRMTTMAARTMGYRVVVLDPTPNSPAGQVADRQITAPYDDPNAVAELGDAADVVTIEFENLPVALVKKIGKPKNDDEFPFVWNAFFQRLLLVLDLRVSTSC